MFSQTLLERKVLHVLAHELRHFWQYYTGEHNKYRNITRGIYRKALMLEVEAENWAEEFLAAYVLKPRRVLKNYIKRSTNYLSALSGGALLVR